MANEVVQKTLQRVFNAKIPSIEDVEFLLTLEQGQGLEDLYAFSQKVCDEFVGKGVLLRGIIEFSNYCKNACHYCGLNRNNLNVNRYRMSQEEILKCVDHIYSKGVRTVVLQSGEDPAISVNEIAKIVEQIMQKYDIAITLSCGERSKEDYKLWKNAGVQRYLLRIESTDEFLYNSLHDGMLLSNRLRCLKDLRDLGYQVGSGIMVGLKGQTVKSIAKDIIFFGEQNFDMMGIGPFIAHNQTPLANEPSGKAEDVLKVVALTRIVTKNSHIPATTALGSLDRDYRIDALKVGANVIMPNFTKDEYKVLYEIYPNKRCINEPAGACVNCNEAMAKAAGKYIDYSIGHSLKPIK
ncbi:MAG: [FeFe] hydrogenase H-cluster radical SAM maturase HydE [Endomicrobiales bacterium]|nr:[FeFe] hydrogenase H-cluster radical SAM maturase HydE [Endomicrobiales bacterium]